MPLIYPVQCPDFDPTSLGTGEGQLREGQLPRTASHRSNKVTFLRYLSKIKGSILRAQNDMICV